MRSLETIVGVILCLSLPFKVIAGDSRLEKKVKAKLKELFQEDWRLYSEEQGRTPFDAYGMKWIGQIDAYTDERPLSLQEFEENDSFAERKLEYVWSGSLEQGEPINKLKQLNKNPICLRELSGEGASAGRVSVEPCRCIGDAKTPSEACKKNSWSGLNHPEPSFRWNFNGQVIRFKESMARKFPVASYWKGTIINSETGRCLTYNYKKADGKKIQWDHKPNKAQIAEVETRYCGTSDENQIWLIWLFNGHPTTKIQPYYGTHALDRCDPPRKGGMDKIGPENTWRGIVSQPGRQEVYYGCSTDRNTMWTPHPWLYKLETRNNFHSPEEKEVRRSFSEVVVDFEREPDPKIDGDDPDNYGNWIQMIDNTGE